MAELKIKSLELQIETLKKEKLELENVIITERKGMRESMDTIIEANKRLQNSFGKFKELVGECITKPKI
jgi:hypothetical protein